MNSIRTISALVVLAVLAAGCSSSPDLIQLDGPAGTIPTTTTIAETTTTVEDTVPDDVETTTTTIVEEQVVESDNRVRPATWTGVDWAEPGTPEEALENAFWAHRSAYENASRAVPPDPDWPTIGDWATVAVEADVREFVGGLADLGVRVSDERPSRIVIVSGGIVSDEEAFVTSCYIDTATTYDIETGALVEEFSLTTLASQTYEFDGERWRLAFVNTLERSTGVDGCALELLS